MTKNRLARGGLVAALAVAGLTVGATPARADETWGFRLTNDGGLISDICVATDRQTVCTGRVPTGHSEVYRVTFSDPASFRCNAKEDFGDNAQTRNFNRGEFKECIWVSRSPSGWIDGKRPDGSTARLS
ncbi:hypothetical protein [Catenuloplanes japonicus]|uniref:hypothetical protein n=1 Tax=Catenuloplanes japonicus TaxID=33876 RepID=UPI0012F727DB|nr:hypothetical protein [Catenuloplanes japonicus]